MSDPISIAPPPPPDPRAGVWPGTSCAARRCVSLRRRALSARLALWFLTSRWRDFASQMAAFAAGSTLTLMLAGTGYLHVPPEVIARSLVLIAVSPRPARTCSCGGCMSDGRSVVFVYGLFFGLHFGTSLAGPPCPGCVPFGSGGLRLGALGGPDRGNHIDRTGFPSPTKPARLCAHAWPARLGNRRAGRRSFWGCDFVLSNSDPARGSEPRKFGLIRAEKFSDFSRPNFRGVPPFL
jgi:hypothetical protein